MNIEERLKHVTKFVMGTGHNITYLGGDKPVTFERAMPEDIIRVQRMSKLVGEANGCKIFLPVEEIYGPLEDEREDTMYIVSKNVADVAARLWPDRWDIVYPAGVVHGTEYIDIIDPATGEPAKFSDGTTIQRKHHPIIGCERFEYARRCTDDNSNG